MRVLALASALLAIAMSYGSDPVKLRVGDSVTITSPYGGDFKIMPDGAIYGRGFGRLVLEGKTWEEAQAAARKALAKFVKPDEVNLTLKDLRRDVVYLVGMNGGRGPVDLTPKLSLRQLLASAPLDDNADLVEVQLFRGGSKLCAYNVAKLISGGEPDQNLLADDVVTLTPASFVRVWITGLVAKPGQLKVPAGTDVYRVIAEAGGFRWPDLEPDTAVQERGKIVVSRGPERIELPIRSQANTAPFVLEAGDTITVVAPELRRITVAGHVNRPGEIVMRGDNTLTGALAMAGGPDGEGTLDNVLVLRNGEVFQHKASNPNPFAMESGDLVFVQRNLRMFMVFGEVSKPGKVIMRDTRAYRLTDALAEAGGLAGRGTLRRVFVARADATGKMKVSQYNLDEFLKDGRAESNPEILPSDCILFGQPKGVTLANMGQFISSALMFESLVNQK